MPLRRDHRHVAQYGARANTIPFVPADVSGLWAHYDFSNISTLFTDTTRTTPVTTSGDIIKGVTDLSGNNRHLTEATNGPTYTTALFNGLAAARFDGSNDVLATGNVTIAQPFTIVGIFARKSTAGAGNNGYIAFASSFTELGIQNTGGSGTYMMYAGTVVTGALVGDTSQHCVVGVFNGASGALRKDGSSSAVNPGVGGGTAEPLQLGKDPGAIFLQADYGEVFIYDTALSAGNLTKVDNYSRSKWGTP